MCDIFPTILLAGDFQNLPTIVNNDTHQLLFLQDNWIIVSVFYLLTLLCNAIQYYTSQANKVRQRTVWKNSVEDHPSCLSLSDIQCSHIFFLLFLTAL